MGDDSLSLNSLKTLSESNNGFLIHDSNLTTYLPNVMQKYAVYLTKGVNIYESRWSPIYIDAFGFG